MKDNTPGNENLTVRAERAVRFAYEEAERFGERYVSTEHLLLGLLREEDTIAVRVLQSLGVSPEHLRAEIEQRVTPRTTVEGVAQALTPRVERVLRLSLEEAKQMCRRYIGTEHLLLGLLREREGLAGRVLARAGLDSERLRAAVERFPVALDAVETLPPATPGTIFRTTSPQDAEKVEALLETLRTGGSLAPRRVKEIWYYVYLFLAAPALLAFILCTVSRMDATVSGLVAIGLFFVTSQIIRRMVLTNEEKIAAQRLTRYRDPRAVGHLIGFLSWPDEAVKAGAMRALTQILPTLPAGEAARLSAALRRRLYSTLNPGYAEHEPAFVLAVLQTAEKLGDATALSEVGKLAAMEGESPLRKHIREAAQDCQASLQARLARQQADRTLLRAASASDLPGEGLLRPASETLENAPEELLRASVSAEESKMSKNHEQE